MANFADLPNELIIKIISHLRSSLWRLNLVKVNHRIHNLIIPILYEDILLDYRDYDTNHSPAIRSRAYRSIHNLFRQLWHPFGTLNLKSSITSISLYVLVHESNDKFRSLEALLRDSYLPCLKHLTLVAINCKEKYWHPDLHSFQPTLSGAKHSLETLVSSTGHLTGCSSGKEGSWSVFGSLADFERLKYLEIQSDVLLGS